MDETSNTSNRRSTGDGNESAFGISRRQALSGLLGAGVLVGAASEPAKAATWSDGDGDGLLETSYEGIDAGTVEATEISSTYHVESIAELNDVIANDITDNGEFDSDGGARIILPDGELNPAASDLPIDLKSGVVIEGQGPKATQINVGGIGKKVFNFDRSSQSVRRHVTLRDLKVLGTWVDNGTPTAGGKGIFLRNIHFWLVENCEFIGLEDGIVVPGSWTGTINRCHVDGCSRDGIRAHYFDNSPKVGMAPNNLRIMNSAVKRSGRYGINLRRAQAITIQGVDVSGTSSYGILADEIEGLVIHGSYTENNGKDLDRDGDGTAEPVQIALSPDSAHNPTQGVSIVGNKISHSAGGRKVGVKLNKVEQVQLVSNWNPARSGKYFVELGPNIKNIHISNNYISDNSAGMVVGPLDGSTIPPEELNDGIWKTSDFQGYDDLASLARGYVKKGLGNSIEVVLTENRSATSNTVDGSDFPAGTLFRGVGKRGTIVTSTGSQAGDFAVRLNRTAQHAENLTVEATGGGIAVALKGRRTAVSDIFVPEAGNDGVRVDGDICSVRDAVCGSGVSRVDIRVEGNGDRIVGCEANVETSKATKAALAANVDIL